MAFADIQYGKKNLLATFMTVTNNLLPKSKRLILVDISIFSLDVAMLPIAAYQNVDDICDGFNLDRDQITLLRLLGTGNFGQVSKAIYGASHSEVAVKSLKGRCFGLLDEFFIKKLQVVQSFSYGRHNSPCRQWS